MVNVKGESFAYQTVVPVSLDSVGDDFVVLGRLLTVYDPHEIVAPLFYEAKTPRQL